MAEMASWFKIEDGGFVFVTDEDVLAYHDQNGEDRSNIPWNDMVGHPGILKVFGIPDKYPHTEGFVHMPDVIKKHIFDGKMDTLFAHAGNLREATQEFIPLIKRLANRYPNVEAQLKSNPYRNYVGKILTFRDNMQVSIENGFVGSTIGELLRHEYCFEDSMLLALKDATKFMDESTDHHHYFNIVNNPNVTRKVLKYMLENIKHDDVVSVVRDKIKHIRAKGAIRKMKKIEKLQVQTIQQGKIKIRTAV